MQTYVSLVKFTQHGLQTMKDKGIERAEMVKQNAKALGGKLVQAYYCLGEHFDLVVHSYGGIMLSQPYEPGDQASHRTFTP